MNMNQTGTIFDIQRYSLHDGPGIRTLIFMKGCPLQCIWCSNPESQSSKIQIGYLEKNCIRCGTCIHACKYEAIDIENFSIKRNCTNCGECAKICHVNAKKRIGEIVSVRELVALAEKDRVFFRNSNGGITVGGGEPVLQADFVAAFLKACKEQHIHTAVETCGYATEEDFYKIINYVDLVLFDLKHMDSIKHKEITGQTNEKILHNAMIAAKSTDTIFRLPLIPGLNDDDENLIATFGFVKEISPNPRLEVLAYHNLGVGKYDLILKEYQLKDLPPYNDIQKDELRAKISNMNAGISVLVV